jgi:4-amino-4-deoxy-L-arabinose transferase-like glycosyltransferase
MAVVSPRALDRLLLAALALVLAVGAGLFLAVSFTMLTYPHEVIVTEGAIGLAVRSIVDGVPLYDAARWEEPPYVIVHYTPVYYLVTAAWTWLSGAGLFGGRLVSILATAATAVLAGWIVKRQTGQPGVALLAGALWLSFYQVVFWGTTQRVDALGTCLESAAILAYLGARRRGRPGYGSLPWFVAAWATKQVMVVGLAAATVDLFLENRRAAVRFAACGFGAIVILFGVLTLWSGGGFWTATVMGTVSGHADPPWVIFSNAELFFGSPWNMLVFVVASWSAARGIRHRWLTRVPSRAIPRFAGSPYVFLGLYLWLGLAVAIATDANLPRFFPPMLAMAILTGLLVHELRRLPRLRTALVFALLFTGCAHTLYEMRSLVRERVLTLHAGSERLLFAAAVERHTTGAGPVLAQDVGMLLSADRPVTVADPYVFSILAGNQAWDAARLVAAVEERRYEAVVLNRSVEMLNDWEWTTLWISPAKEALQEHYRLAEVVSIEQTWRFLEPKRYIYVPSGSPGTGPDDTGAAMQPEKRRPDDTNRRPADVTDE